MEKENFIDEVRSEIEHLKANTTDEEKARLDFDSFNHNDPYNCIYGQMTEKGYSPKELELYSKKYIVLTNVILIPSEDINKFKEQPFKIGNNYTPLEKYLYMINNETRKQILLYLKGETQTLNLQL